MPSSSCAFCKTALAPSNGFIFCQKCNAPDFAGPKTSPFDVMGVAPTYTQDLAGLESRYYELSRRLHPDRFASAEPSLKIRAQELSALLNDAYLKIKAPDSRLESLLKLFDQDTDKNTDQRLPMDLANEYFEIQEAVMEDPGKAASMIQNFRLRILEKRESLDRQIAQLAESVNWQSPGPHLKNEIETLLTLRKERSYIRSMLENLVRLGAPS